MKSTTLVWIIRIVISLLFLVSAAAKMIDIQDGSIKPTIWMFEKQLVDLKIADWCMAHYLARLILALEIAIGIGVLTSHYMRRLVLPVTIGLLVAFCIHLSWQIAVFGNNGNCGCFGQLIPMTPLEALIKNIITIALALWLWRKLKPDNRTSNRLMVPFAIYGLSALFMFAAFPFCPCEKETSVLETTVVFDDEAPTDSLTTSLPVDTIVQTGIITPDSGLATPVTEPEPTVVKSKFASIVSFGGKNINLDKGKKIVCCFAPGCDHCQATAKELATMAKKGGMPPVYIVFMDEEVEKIPDFFKTSGLKANYTVLDIPKFWTLMGSDNTPAVYYLWNGNVRYQCEGTEGKAFNASALGTTLTGQ
jgi:thiol-disulfide isomerase/thioredoxin